MFSVSNNYLILNLFTNINTNIKIIIILLQKSYGPLHNKSTSANY